MPKKKIWRDFLREVAFQLRPERTGKNGLGVKEWGLEESSKRGVEQVRPKSTMGP